MAYSELVKDFNRVRGYLRDFLIFGFKSRKDFTRKSPRTYDNERRRIESWLKSNLRWEYTSGGKTVFLSLDASESERNPLYRAWKSKSFTDNDITLHFYLLDILADGTGRHAEEIADELAARGGKIFDAHTVRRKLKEYEKAGILKTSKEGKRLLYFISPLSVDTLFPKKTGVKEFLSFFGEAAPLAVIGSFISDRLGGGNPYVRFKHHFIAHTIDDGILITILTAIKNGTRLEITNVNEKSGRESNWLAIPLKVMISVQNGRRYLAACRTNGKGLMVFRLDYIKTVKQAVPCLWDNKPRLTAKEWLGRMWGVSITNKSGVQSITMTIKADEEKEGHIITRLLREGRGGKVDKAGPNLWRYTNNVYDTREMMSWIKTFTGRIVYLEGDDKTATKRFYHDMERMAEIYGIGK